MNAAANIVKVEAGLLVKHVASGVKIWVLSVENGRANLKAQEWGEVSMTVETIEKGIAEGRYTEI